MGAAAVAAGWVVILLAVLSFGWLLTHPWEASVDPWDDGVVRWFADHRTGELDSVAAAATFLGDIRVGIVLAAVVGLGLSVWRRSVRPVLLLTVAVAGELGLYLAGTHLVPRDRPPVRILDRGLTPDHSFPSGHVATAVVVYGGTALLLAAADPRLRRWTWVLLVLPVAVAVARLYQGAHHPTDVLTSLVLASAWLAAVSRVVLRRTDGPATARAAEAPAVRP